MYRLPEREIVRCLIRLDRLRVIELQPGNRVRHVLPYLKRVLQNAARECLELIERDRSSPQTRRGAAIALALRPWAYRGFRPFERP
jgi:hypothetical protein